MDNFWDSLQHLFDTQMETDLAESFDVDPDVWYWLVMFVYALIVIVVNWLVIKLILKLYNKCQSEIKEKKATAAAAASEPQPQLIKFSYKWNIKDFLCCDLLSNAEHIDSAEFSPPGFASERFSLRIHPRAGTNGKDVSLYLRYNSTAPAPEPVEKPKKEGEEGSEEKQPTPAPATATQPEEKKAQIQFACSILGSSIGLCGLTKVSNQEIKAVIKSGQNIGWVAFANREQLLNSGISYKCNKDLTVYFEGCYIASK